MTSTQFCTLILLSILLFGCSNEDDADNQNNLNQRVNTIVHDGESREYILYVPESYDGTFDVPLMLNFHGFGGDISSYMEYADMRPQAESEKFILIYPQGTLMDGFSHWNPSLPHADNKSNADDLGFIEALISELSTDYMIDTKRIYACGYSNGAMMSYGLASHKSELIAAVGSISGTMLDTDSIPSHSMPVIIIHGTSDSVLPYNGNSEFNSVEMVVNYWVNFNDANTTPITNTIEDNGTNIVHYQYTQGLGSVSVEHYKIVEGKHVWFNLNYQESNTSDLIWNFVSRYDTEGLREEI